MDEIAGSTCSTLRRSTPRFESLLITISRNPRNRAASSAVRVILSFSARISAVVPLKSNRVAREERDCISICDVCLDGKFAWLPPFVSQDESAATHCDIHVTETVTIDESTSSQAGVDVLPTHSLD